MQKLLLTGLFGISLFFVATTCCAQADSTVISATPTVAFTEKTNPITPTQEERRGRYFNISYAKQQFKVGGRYSLTSDYGAALTRGRTYYLHEKPIVGMIRFGLDWTTFDLNFAGYSCEEHYDSDADEMVKNHMYQAEVAMHFGPSLTIEPVRELKLNGYFRVAPSFTAFYDDDFYYNYGTFFVAGGAVSYKVISLGIEGRWGSANLKIGENDEKEKAETTGARFYVSFRF